jgi:hypothetical protein
VIRTHSGFFQRLARAALSLLALAALASCGSGGVNPPPDFTKMTILPATATVFSGTPTTFSISGGIAPYLLASDNAFVVPASGPFTGSSFVVVPNTVASDTVVNLTLRDSSTVPLTQGVAITVKPGTVSNTVTITPTSTQGGTCTPAICSGSDALVSATLVQNTLPLPGRGVRFEVVSGTFPFRFITSNPGSLTETFDTTFTTVSDASGTALARLRVSADATNQTAVLRVTDLVSGSVQYATFAIAQATGSSPGFFALPSSITFTGPRIDLCAPSTQNAQIVVFGGSPPYTVSSTSSGFSLSSTIIGASGGNVLVTPNGTCVATPGAPIVIRDSAGRTTTVLASSVVGTAAVPTLVVGPTKVTLTTCNQVATVVAAGGTGNYIGNSLSGGVIMLLTSNNLFSIQRLPGTPSPGASGIVIPMTVTDGVTSVQVDVTLTGLAAGPC